MKVFNTIAEIQAARWENPRLSWGLVPTMGYLHQGHLSLVEKASLDNERVIATIFVNPTQFAEGEDLSSYPRNLERDLSLLEKAGCDFVFVPQDREMYPAGFQTAVSVNVITKNLEGASRPTHFGGVATVVSKLFNITQPTRAYFGQKDAQQTIVLKQLVQDLNFNLELIVCPTVREADGLAMSSRNAYLSEAERTQAPILNQALNAAKSKILAGESDAEQIRQLIKQTIETQPLAKIDYVSVANGHSLEELTQIEKGDLLLSTAVFFGKTRLIDNLPISL
ncbi:MAG: pantoate--beta-alanine ligase [Chloroflexota bacterium]